MKKNKIFIRNSLHYLKLPILLLIVFVAVANISSGVASASPLPAHFAFNMPEDAGKYTCGGGSQAVQISVDLGCDGKGNALVDASFAIIRFLSVGIGMLVVASLVFAGVQYTSSRGDPAATARAMERVRSTLIALLVYIFAAAILDFVIPKGILHM